MVDAQYSLADVAKITGKSEKTISRWIKSGKLPALKHGTGYLINEKDIPLKIDPAMDRHHYIQKRLLEHQTKSAQPAPKSGGVDIGGLVDVAGLIAGGQVDIQNQKMDNISMMLHKHQSEVEKILREQNELAEKYARATYKIGQLEERNRLLEDGNQKLEQKMSLLPLPEQWSSTQQEVTELKQNIRQKEDQHHEKESYYQKQVERLQSSIENSQKDKDKLEALAEQLKSELEAERNKGFWPKLKGLFS